ncbi:4Fe-4S binding protein [Clostridium cochlearium]|uniref:2Fe-2S iron-sulfur cluster-binding protein n=1 Tax=Clostridium cochlearium TaxID=1494 RepID=UPI001459945D|nr:2Fe-2S iron-sulfur cluster-binding protein [Clostridium cochlearium]NME94555.1 4Fe-4S binding protein [Clostridium cochlearium]
MIISLRSLSYEELKSKLSKDDKIVLWTCNTCIKFCGIGGFDKLVTLEKLLKSDRYNVIGKELVSIACMYSLAEQHKNDPKKRDMFNEATTIITLTCEDGYINTCNVFKDKKVIGIAKTLGIGNFSMDRGPILTHPFESTGLEQTNEGYTFPEVASKLNLYPTFFDAEATAKENEEEFVEVTINNKKYKAKEGETLLKFCEDNGIFIPHLCYEEDLTSEGACRLCLVKVKGERGLVPSCCTKITKGMEVITEDDELNHYRKVILELLLSRGEHNCLYCSKGNPCIVGSCELQDLVRKFGIESTPYEIEEPKKVDKSSPMLKYDPNKCILCGRCIRACEEIAAQNNLGFINRGSKTVVAAGANKEFDQSACVTCLACVFACPTGAITEKITHYSGDNWEETEIRQS